ncbi:MAG: hypothetical protein IK013_04015 [Bacteroidales bacterium]|nr:hypothetical protein [Bacteroidales bacterium]
MKKAHRRFLSFLISLILLLVVAGVSYYFIRKHFHQNLKGDVVFEHPMTGIDISSYTGTVDFRRASEDSIRFVYMRATMGVDGIDTLMPRHHREVTLQTDLPVGFYHFLRFDEDGSQQADHFFEVIRSKSYDLMPVVDVEDWSNPSDKSTQQRIQVIEDFIRRFETISKNRVMIYTNLDGYRKYIQEKFPKNPLWICSLNGQPNIGQPYLFWQYQHNARFPWAKGDVDLNTFHGTEQMLAFLTVMVQSQNTDTALRRTLNILCDTAYGLNVFYPQYDCIDLVCGTMPTAEDSDIIFCAEAAFTGEELRVFRHQNIAGDHVSDGTFYKGYVCDKNSGCFVWYDHQPHFLTTNINNALHLAARRGGMGFCQVCIIHKGKTQPLWRKNDNYYRALCLKDGKVCIADSQEKIPYAQFVKQLENYGMQEALYMDMGPGWNHSWYRDNHNHVQELFPHTHNFTTNWIVFKKS